VHPLENLTVVIPNFHRAAFLDRALDSVRAAGVLRVVVASSEPDGAVDEVLKKHDHGWKSFDVAREPTDIGANLTWIMGARHSRTERIVLLYDDDFLLPGFGQAYVSKIAPALAAGAGFATWENDMHHENGRIAPSRYWTGPAGTRASADLLSVIAKRGRLSLSPALGVFDRETLIRACEEAQQNLTSPESYTRPGMLIGNDLLIYYRHIQAFPNWYYAGEVLGLYGHHPGSETVSLANDGRLAQLVRAYDLTRDYAEKSQYPSSAVSKIRHVVSTPGCPSPDAARRMAFAASTWSREYEKNPLRWEQVGVPDASLSRNGKSIGDPHAVPFIRDLIARALTGAAPTDIVFLTNSDVCFVPGITQKILEEVGRNGSAYAYRWDFRPPLTVPISDESELKSAFWYVGCDAFAFSVGWWAKNESMFPDMLLGRPHWDPVLRAMVKLTGGTRIPKIIYHEDHGSFWKTGGRIGALPGNIWNGQLAVQFYRKFTHGVIAWRFDRDTPETVGGPAQATSLSSQELQRVNRRANRFLLMRSGVGHRRLEDYRSAARKSA